VELRALIVLAGFDLDILFDQLRSSEHGERLASDPWAIPTALNLSSAPNTAAGALKAHDVHARDPRHTDPATVGNDFPQQVQAFAQKVNGEQSHYGNVSAWPIETGYQAKVYRIALRG